MPLMLTLEIGHSLTGKIVPNQENKRPGSTVLPLGHEGAHVASLSSAEEEGKDLHNCAVVRVGIPCGISMVRSSLALVLQGRREG